MVHSRRDYEGDGTLQVSTRRRKDAKMPRLVQRMGESLRSEAAIMDDPEYHSKIAWRRSGTASLRLCVFALKK
jgi:hypothetical protein